MSIMMLAIHTNGVVPGSTSQGNEALEDFVPQVRPFRARYSVFTTLRETNSRATLFV